MRQVIAITASLLFFFSCRSQTTAFRGEFATHINGLMYSDSDMKALRFIVDSLNLRFKTCDLNKTYYACPQVRAYTVSFESETNDLKAIIEQFEKKKSFQEIVSDFSSYISTIDSNQLFIRFDKDNEDSERIYLHGSPGEGYDYPYWDKENNIANKPLLNEWLYNYYPKDEDSGTYSLTGCYFPQPWKHSIIPERYSRLILYVDCMIDTSASIFLTDKFSGDWENSNAPKNGYYNLEDLGKYLDSRMSVENNNKKLQQLSDSQVSFVLKELQNDSDFKSLLATTIEDYVKNKQPEHTLERLAVELNMPAHALLLKRCYRVMGFCSQDTRPREHARDIATLAAQAHSWDIFLRSHLDIMNDRFERRSDGSYAYNSRKTYLKELEELNLNIVDLMLGLSLRAENIASNHYYGSLWRMGWALTESRERNVFEEKAMAMIRDEELDEFNRGLIFILYVSYIDRLADEEAKEKRNKLKENINSFPLFIQHAIQNMEDTDSD